MHTNVEPVTAPSSVEFTTFTVDEAAVIAWFPPEQSGGDVQSVESSTTLWIRRCISRGRHRIKVVDNPDRQVSLLCKASSMASDSSVVAHYESDGALDRIRHELTAAGHDIESLTPEALSGVDEFHLGGRLATTALLDSMNVGASSAVLDVGSGIGGVARTIAAATGASVTGVDLTPSFVMIARELSALVGLSEATQFDVADALSLPFDDATFDAVTMVHVGMNIDDKNKLFAELARVTRPGGRVHVYDIMRVGDGDITYPVPWSSTPETSFVARPADYADAMTAAGLTPADPVDHLDLVRRAVASAQANPPAVNLSHLMGSEWPTMISNLLACLNAGVLSPTEIVATV